MIVFISFVFLCFRTGLGIYGFSVLNIPVSEQFGWGRVEVTAAFFFYLISGAVFASVAGRLSDKFGPRKTLFLGAAVHSLSFILLSRTSALWNFYLLHICLGAGYSLMGTVPISVLISNWFHKSKGTFQGLAFTGIGFGGLAFAPLIGNWILPEFGWRVSYLIMGLLFAAIILPLLFFIRDYPSQKGLLPYGYNGTSILKNGNGNKIAGLNFRQMLGTYAFWMIILTSIIYGMIMTGTLQNQVGFMNEWGFTTHEAVFAIGILGLSSGFGKFFFGYLCDHLDPKYTTAIAYILMASSLATVVLARSTTVYLVLYATLSGLGAAGWAPNLAMLAAKYFGLKYYGEALGALQMIFTGAQAVGPVFVAFTFDQTGSYRPVLIVLLILCIASVAIITFIRKPRIVSA